MFLDDLLVLLVQAGVGTPWNGTTGNIFTSSAAKIPAGGGPYLTISETGGSGPEGTHNDRKLGLPGYQRPNAQLLVRATNYEVARVMIVKAYDACVAVGSKSQMINGVWWRSINVLQEPFDFGVDGVGRACLVFNISVTKKPNAATSV